MKTLDASSYTTALGARREQSLGQMAYDRLLDMWFGGTFRPGPCCTSAASPSCSTSRAPRPRGDVAAGDRGLIERQPGGMLVVKEFSLRELIEICMSAACWSGERKRSPPGGYLSPYWTICASRSRPCSRRAIQRAGQLGGRPFASTN